jgi:long-subunit acyl-CoA synthetase (AMP-forming)
MSGKNKSELVKQIEAFGLKNKLADLARREEARRPFRHLPKQFSKGILIGNIAIVPKKHTGTRYVYVIADMLEARILHEDINLKQTAILVAHYLADDKTVPQHILDLDTKFASQLFDIQNAKRMIREAQKDEDELTEDVYWDRLDVANRLADECKSNIQRIFNDTFGA